MIRIIVFFWFVICWLDLLGQRGSLVPSAKPAFKVFDPSAGDPYTNSTRDTLYFVWFWGQSNMEGNALLSNIPENRQYIRDTTEFKLIQKYNRGVSTYKIDASGQHAGDFDPLASFADTVFKTTLDTVFMLKTASGNTSLAVNWAPGTGVQWNQMINAYHYYREWYLIKQNKIVIPIAFVCMQGENDATNETWANDYQTNFENFIDTIRAISRVPDLPFIVGEVNGIDDPSMTYRNIVRAAQYAVCVTEIDLSGNASTTAGTRTNTYLVDTDFYTFNDVVHYDAVSTIQFGWDLFRAMVIANIYSP
jgi:hypothetical protein